eukprot:176636_1
MSFNYSEIKKYDQRTKDVIFGYVRDVQKLFNRNQTTYHNMPPLIVSTIFWFYHLAEYFSVCGDYITLQNNNNCAKCSKYVSCGNSIYGNFKINNSIGDYKCIWTFKIQQFAEDLILKIGIDSSNRQHVNTACNTTRNSYYVMQMNEGLAAKCINESTANQCFGNRYLSHNNNFVSHYAKYDNTLDVLEITMEFNTQSKSLKYYINGQDK